MSNYKGLFHVSLHVKDTFKSIEFYEKLGLKFMFKLVAGEDQTAEPWVVYMRISDGQYLEIQSVNAETPEGIPDNTGVSQYDMTQSIWHFALETENIEQTISELVNSGVEMYTGPDKLKRVYSVEDAIWGGDGCRIAWTIDPDGTPIEIMEQVGETMQRKYDK